ncbi:MAG: type II toxin-antitoxin system VapC family toxin [Saprospiraceae bacterium]
MIVDTNVLIQVYTNETVSYETVFDNYVLEAPDFVKIEFLNVMRKMHFLNNVPLSKLELAYEKAMKLIYRFYSSESLLYEAKAISFQLNHPIYDCLFLALAIRSNQPFLSSDMRLLKKAESIGVKTVYF